MSGQFNGASGNGFGRPMFDPNGQDSFGYGGYLPANTEPGGFNAMSFGQNPDPYGASLETSYPEFAPAIDPFGAANAANAVNPPGGMALSGGDKAPYRGSSATSSRGQSPDNRPSDSEVAPDSPPKDPALQYAEWLAQLEDLPLEFFDDLFDRPEVKMLLAETCYRPEIPDEDEPAVPRAIQLANAIEAAKIKKKSKKAGKTSNDADEDEDNEGDDEAGLPTQAEETGERREIRIDDVPPPIYPAYSNYFRSGSEARTHRRSVRVPPKVADDLAKVKRVGRQYWVKRIYEAMIDTSAMVDGPGSIHRKRFTTTKAFEPQDLEAAAHHIFDAAIAVHERGWNRPKVYHKNVKRGKLADVSAGSVEKRLMRICIKLKQSKAVVDDALRGGLTLHLLCDNPEARGSTKVSNNIGNLIKGLRIQGLPEEIAALEEFERKKERRMDLRRRKREALKRQKEQARQQKQQGATSTIAGSGTSNTNTTSASRKGKGRATAAEIAQQEEPQTQGRDQDGQAEDGQAQAGPATQGGDQDDIVDMDIDALEETEEEALVTLLSRIYDRLKNEQKEKREKGRGEKALQTGPLTEGLAEAKTEAQE